MQRHRFDKPPAKRICNILFDVLKRVLDMNAETYYLIAIIFEYAVRAYATLAPLVGIFMITDEWKETATLKRIFGIFLMVTGIFFGFLI